MYLEKLEAQGFKSFASKNSLVFPGMIDKDRRGITAVVGPNGSGKSNIADAIRWVLGEQSMKTLRGKKSEDIIFSGSDKKGKLGMAEVSLFLNNEDKKAPLDYSQIVLTRRLYRDGASEYILNNSRVRLADVQMLLAKAKFGQRTYSVIGQGMVEGFLNTSLAERKEFFDEATGVKQFQIKRDDSLNKLRASYENLAQVQMLLEEIEPRLKSLTRQIHKLERRGELEAELREMQLIYYGKTWHEINDKLNEYNNEFLDLEKIKIEKDKRLILLNKKLEEMEKNTTTNQELASLQEKLGKLQSEKNEIIRQLAKVEAQIEIKLESSGKFDLSWLNNKKVELFAQAEIITKDLLALKEVIAAEDREIKQIMGERDALGARIGELNKTLVSSGNNDINEDVDEIKAVLKKLIAKIENVAGEEDVLKLKNAINEIKEDLKNVLNQTDDYDKKENFENVQGDLIRLAQEKEDLINKINERNLKISGARERATLLAEQQNNINREIAEVESKLKAHGSALASKEVQKEKDELDKKMEAINGEMGVVREEVAKISADEEEKRASFFSMQRNVQNLQNEINGHNNKLNEIKINSTRYETRLEDLEGEIRLSFKDLGEIKKNKIEGHVEIDLVADKINSIKKQLEMIGGIDPETEKEYIETKERYDFLSGQVHDLHGAINSLEQVIKELDITIKDNFDKEFKLISKKFEEYFQILFNGGHARIIKVMADEKEKEEEGEKPKEEKTEKDETRTKPMIDIKKIKFLQKHNATGLAGIEIQATPPGKKIASVSMLSGGERALTAIALICAIISANPSPFVVLDEVDAALDEANSERLAKILDDLSHKTQFIIITHNRASMRRASVLYGVTMQDDGVSKLLSIKLDEAEKKVRS